MKVIIAGAGRTGAQLARFLLQQDHEVIIIENRREILARIHRELPTEVIIEGNPIDPAILEKAGMMDTQVVAACTASDEVNLTFCFMAREKYRVRRTIARVNNPHNAWLFGKLFRVDVSMNQAEILAHLIEEEMSMGDMMTLLKLRRGNYSLVEEKIPEGAIGIGKAIKDLNIEHCVIAAIIRHGDVIVPRGVTTFEAGDEVLAVTDPEGAQELEDLFSKPRQSEPDRI